MASPAIPVNAMNHPHPHQLQHPPQPPIPPPPNPNTTTMMMVTHQQGGIARGRIITTTQGGLFQQGGQQGQGQGMTMISMQQQQQHPPPPQQLQLQPPINHSSLGGLQMGGVNNNNNVNIIAIQQPGNSNNNSNSNSGGAININNNSSSSSSAVVPMEVDGEGGGGAAAGSNNDQDDESPLTVSELQMLSGLDSRQFGFLGLDAPENAKKKALIQKAITQIERLLIEEQRQNNEKDKDKDGEEAMDEDTPKKITIDPKTFNKLGHFQLLLEDYAKAMSAYQKYYEFLGDEYYKEPTLLYGLGLCYFHFNAFQLAQHLFQTLLYVEPTFIRSNEVHLRLASIHKIHGKGNISRALKHFNLALSDTSSPSTFTPFQIKFHIAHLYEVVGQPKVAKDHYEGLLKEKDLPDNLRAITCQQLAWITHNCDLFGDKNQREPVAIHYLQKALDCDPRSGQSLYLLGRCFASVGKVHDAFLAYRNSVDKSEGNADTWCSIGVLYQQQNQPLDALQAYICAVQLDKFHVSAWTNLGVLYESVNQPKDALACYVNAGRGFLKKNSSKEMNQSLQRKIHFIQNGLAKAPPQTNNSKPRHLPVIEEAWNLPISAEMTARQQQQNNQRHQNKGHSEIPPKRIKLEEGSSSTGKPIGLTQNQLQALQVLQNHVNQGFQLNPQQQQIYNQLSQQYRLVQAHQQQLQQQQQQQQQNRQSNTTNNNNNNEQGPSPSFTANDSRQNSLNSITTPAATLPQDNSGSITTEDIKSPRSIGALSGSPPFSPNVSDQELQAWLNQKDLGLGDDLLKGCNVDLDDLELMDEDLVGGGGSNNNNSNHEDNNGRMRSLSFNSDRGESSPPEIMELNISMSAKELRENCKGDIKDMKKIVVCNILGDKAPPPKPPVAPSISLSDDQLIPPAPSVFIENKKDAFSPMLQEFCLQQPIAVVRGIAAALKLDLGLFSTKSLVEAHPDHPVEIRYQNFKNYDENVDANGKVTWDCFSRRAHSAVQHYAQYQASTFKESVKEEEDKNQGIYRGDSDSDSKDSSGNKKKRLTKQLRFGTNVDLSDERKWKDQLAELQKLPAFARVMSAGNMLSHVGHVILGMNTVQLYMKVPGSRTPGHQENNNFCSININIGPGDCEWFAVPDAYWGKIYELCEKNGIQYLHGSWWPNLEDCAKAKIPVYRFTQKPGDLVWVNSGCVHWVQAMGWCNNIAWNVGPLSPRQYSLAIERYEWNKLQNFKSIVPMIHLSWNLARNIRVTDPKLFELVKSVLLRTMTHCFRLLEFVKSKGVTVRFHGKTKNDASHYCGQCEIEVFNILFIKEQEKRHVVHCVNCALKATPELNGFMCLEEYKMEELMTIYDEFVLHNLPPVPQPQPPPPALLPPMLTIQQPGPSRSGPPPPLLALPPPPPPPSKFPSTTTGTSGSTAPGVGAGAGL